MPNQNLPPGPKGIFLLGNFLDFRKYNVLDFGIKLGNEYGDISHVKLGNKHVLFFSNPHDVNYLFTNTGNDGKYEKAQVPAVELISGNSLNTLCSNQEWQDKTKLFCSQLIAMGPDEYEKILNVTLNRVFNHWEASSLPDKKPINASMDILHITVSMMAEAMLGVNANVVDSGLINLHKYRIVKDIIIRPLKILALPVFMRRDLLESIQYKVTLVNQIVDNYLRHPTKNSYLEKLVAKYNVKQAPSENILNMIGEVLSALYLGSDPLDKLISWSLYFLSMYPEEKDKVFKEIDQVTQGKELTLSQVDDLSYTRMVLNEVLRLRPPYSVIARAVLEEDEIRGYTIPKNALCMVLPLLVHKHRDFWENPEAFFPERFRSIETENNIAYIPFSAGLRNCPGQNFAYRQSLFILGRILQRYDFSLLPNQNYAMKFLGVLSCESDIQGFLTKR